MNLEQQFAYTYLRNSYVIYNNKFNVSLEEFINKMQNEFWIKFIDKPQIGYYCITSNDKEAINRLSNKLDNIEIKFKAFDNTKWFPINKQNLLTIIN